jgi:hypothetical protein
MEDMRNAHKILVGKTKGKKNTWGLKINLTKIGFGGADFRGYNNELQVP